MSFWESKRVLVTGGSGFLGSVVVQQLKERGCQRIAAPRSREFDLREAPEVARLFDQALPNVVIHLAAVVGGIGANRRNPGRFFYDNALMGIQVIEQARRCGVEKFICLGTICAYPKFCPVPFREENLWDGYPEETNAPYGLAKKMLLVQLQAYRQEYGFNGVYLLPVNLYGPGDNFDLATSHVIPGLIRKCVEARRRGDNRITAWGSGNVTREFLHVEDAAEGILLAAKRYNRGDPINLGTGEEITIRGLAEMIRELTGFKGAVDWDKSQPDGQPRRCLDISRAAEEFGFEPRIRLREGLGQTIRWYENHLDHRREPAVARESA
jgi:GDP-L-fucose synthase